MRILEPKKELKESQKEEPQEEKKESSFNDLLVEQLAKEMYGMNFYRSLSIKFKASSYHGIGNFFLYLSRETEKIASKILKFLLDKHHSFDMPKIEAVNTNKSLFESAVSYEENRLKELYDIKCPCSVTQNFIDCLIEKHMSIHSLATDALKISNSSDDSLLIQQTIFKLYEQKC